MGSNVFEAIPSLNGVCIARFPSSCRTVAARVQRQLGCFKQTRRSVQAGEWERAFLLLQQPQAYAFHMSDPAKLAPSLAIWFLQGFASIIWFQTSSASTL